MRPRRTAASLLSAVTILGGMLAAAAPSASAGPNPNGTPTAGELECGFYLSGGFTAISSGPVQPGSDYPDTFTLTQSPASPLAGQTVTVTLHGNTGALNGPAGISEGEEDVLVNAKLSSGLSFQLNSANAGGTNVYPSADVLPTNGANGNQYLGPWTATGTYVAPAAGANTLTIQQVDLLNPFQGANFYCSDVGGITPTGTAANDGSGTYAHPTCTYVIPGGGAAGHQPNCSGTGGPPSGDIGNNQKAYPNAAIYQNFTIGGPTVVHTSTANDGANLGYTRAGFATNFSITNFDATDTTYTAQLCAVGGSGCDAATASQTKTVTFTALSKSAALTSYTGGTGAGTLSCPSSLTTYPSQTYKGVVTSGSAVVPAQASNTVTPNVGDPITGTGIPANTTVLSVTGTAGTASITMSANATSGAGANVNITDILVGSASAAKTFYGTISATTFTLPGFASAAGSQTCTVTPQSGTGAGFLSGGAGVGQLVPTASDTTGLREVLVTGAPAGDSAYFTITVETNPQVTYQSVTGGGAGTRVTMTITNLNPGNCNTYLYGFKANPPAGASDGTADNTFAGSTGNPAGPACAASDGTYTGTLQVNLSNTVAVGAIELGVTYTPLNVTFAYAPFSFSGTSCVAAVGSAASTGCSLIESFSLVVNPGNLGMYFSSSAGQTAGKNAVTSASQNLSGTLVSGSTALTLATATNPVAGDQLSGTGIPANTTVVSVAGSGIGAVVTMSNAASATIATAETVVDTTPVGISGWSVNDGSTTTSSLTSKWNSVSGTLTLPSITLNGNSQQISGPLVGVDVYDYRGASLGWTLTGKFSGLSNGGSRGGDKIPVTALNWTPTCAPMSNNDSTFSTGNSNTGAPASFASTTVALPLCQDQAAGFGASGLSDGDTVAGATLALTAPADLAVGLYTGTLTLLLV